MMDVIVGIQFSGNEAAHDFDGTETELREECLKEQFSILMEQQKLQFTKSYITQDNQIQFHARKLKGNSFF